MVSEYFLGLDIGTNSIGWAVTDKFYKLVRIKGKDLWGVHLFDDAKSMAKRREFRCARRRIARRRKRIKLLREFFEAEISKIDPGFFERLDDSFFIEAHKKENQKNTLFNDKNFKDKDFHKKYKTIYHLRSALIHSNEKFDIRIIYLAIAHILKNRGHFLFDDENMDVGVNFSSVYNEWCAAVEDMCNNNDEEENEHSFYLTDTSEIEKILKQKNGKKEKKTQIKKIFSDKSIDSLLDLLIDGKVKTSKIFKWVDDKAEPKDICFNDGNFDEKKDSIVSLIGEENMHVIELTKALYDWGILSELLGDNEYISDAKVNSYIRHGEDSKLLKKVINKYCSEEKYIEVFEATNLKNNYAAYVNGGIVKGKKIHLEKPEKGNDNNEKKSDKQAEFYKYIGKILDEIKMSDPDIDLIKKRIDDKTFMQKQVSTENSVIPHQVHLHELKKILKNAEKHYPFLCEKDEYGTVSDKIISILTFRIPYYVGPLNKAKGKNAWICKKESMKDISILPWNFDDVVNIEESAEKFITRMTNYCTYITSEKVLPKNSILYCTYEMLSELNNLSINGEKLSYELKTKIIDEVFKKKATPKIKHIESFLKNEFAEKDLKISGLADDFKSSLKPYIDFHKIIGDRADNTEMVEEIIRLITIFGDDKKILINKIEELFGGEFSEKEIKAISSLKYSGWGRFSKKLLDGITTFDESTGEEKTIIKIMEETSENFMQIIFDDKYSFKSTIEEEEANNNKKYGTYASLDDLYVSPANKKRIWRAISIVKEIVKINKSAPKKIFIEMARGKDEKNNDNTPRKKKLDELYKSIKNEDDLKAELDGETDVTLRRKKRYLYYMQLGRCMYSGKRLTLEEVDTKCDIDHIIPQSVKKDDSFENTVLVLRTLNEAKGNTYPIDEKSIISPEAKENWKILRYKKFLSEEKYNRIIRKTNLTDDEKAGFINRQLVETRQTTKLVAKILGKMYPETEIVYVKASQVSNFRNGAYIKKEEKEQYKDDKLIKCREINDYHHAKDAYLNIVAGNIFNEKFNHNPAVYSKYKRPYSLVEFVRSGEKYNLARIYEYDLPGANWIGGHDGTIEQIKKVMSKNNILCSSIPQEQTGKLFNQMPVKAGNAEMPFKMSASRLSENKDRYGGYNSIKNAYFSIIRSVKKGKKLITIEPVYLYMKNEINYDDEKLKKYFESQDFSDVEILVPCLKINTLIKMDGAYIRIASRGDNRIKANNDMQLVVDSSSEKYIKGIIKFKEMVSKNNTISAKDYNIVKEKNIELYDKLIDKIRNTIYKYIFNSYIEKLESARNTFENLNIDEQAFTLFELLKLYQCNSDVPSFKFIDCKCQRIRFNKDITKCSEFKIIHQSLTGFYEKEIDVLKL